MAFPWGPVLSAGANLVGAGLGFLGGERQNVASARAAQTMMDFQERMYRNRYTYQMEDMRRAGLNPILAFGQSPPGAPGGASYSPVNVGEPLQRGISAGVSSALAAKRLREDTANIRAEAERRSEAAATERSTRMVQSHQIKNLMIDYDLKEQQMFSARANAARAAALWKIIDTPSYRTALKIGEHYRAAAASSYAPPLAAGIGAASAAAVLRHRRGIEASRRDIREGTMRERRRVARTRGGSR